MDLGGWGGDAVPKLTVLWIEENLTHFTTSETDWETASMLVF